MATRMAMTIGVMTTVGIQPIGCTHATRIRAIRPITLPANNPLRIPESSICVPNHWAGFNSKLRGPCKDRKVERLAHSDVEATTVEFSPGLYAWPHSATAKDASWVRCNMVMTQDGAAAGPDGRSASIASPIDKTVFSALRRDSDVILVGAGTARAEGYRPAAVPIALVSRTLALPDDLPLLAQREPDSPKTYLLTTAMAMASAPAGLAAQAEIIDCGQTEVDLARALLELRSRGLTRVHSEGGPTLLTSLIKAKLLDELLLTITPVIQGASTSLIGPLDTPVFGKFSQVLIEDGTLLLRFLPDYG